MTNTETYYKEATDLEPKAPLHQRSTAAMQKLADKAAHKLDGAGLNRRNLTLQAQKTARKAREGAVIVGEKAKKHAVPLTIGAVAIGVISALLINSRTRNAGVSMFRRMTSKAR